MNRRRSWCAWVFNSSYVGLSLFERVRIFLPLVEPQTGFGSKVSFESG